MEAKLNKGSSQIQLDMGLIEKTAPDCEPRTFLAADAL